LSKWKYRSETSNRGQTTLFTDFDRLIVVCPFCPNTKSAKFKIDQTKGQAIRGLKSRRDDKLNVVYSGTGMKFDELYRITILANKWGQRKNSKYI